LASFAHVRDLEKTEITRIGVCALMTGFAEILTVRDLVVTARRQRFLVVELFGGESTVAVVRTPTVRALTRSAGALSSELLN